MSRPTIVLTHLYGDLLNLYGENGNLKVLAATLAAAGFSVRWQKYSVGDRLDLSGSDLVYIGCGTEASQLVALRHLRQQQAAIEDYLDAGGLLLATGNAVDLFGQAIAEPGGRATTALGLFDYRALRLVGREVGEVLFRFADNYLIGFQNRGSRIECDDPTIEPLFLVDKGFSYQYALPAASDNLEGAPAGKAAAGRPKPLGGVNEAGVGVAGSLGSQPPQQEGLRIGGFVASSVLGLITRNPAFIVWLVGQLLEIKARKPIQSQPPLAASSCHPVSDYSPDKDQLLAIATWSDAARSTDNSPGNPEADFSKSTRLAYELLDLHLDVVAFRDFLANHHGILHS